mmetsp:Transcript_13964/g.39596  ORF Transcript_13964/g.39596 Transcript_13964/m.39596 type:complete len:96 (+) Transcript_13964:1671-1958(+)
MLLESALPAGKEATKRRLLLPDLGLSLRAQLFGLERFESKKTGIAALCLRSADCIGYLSVFLARLFSPSSWPWRRRRASGQRGIVFHIVAICHFA